MAADHVTAGKIEADNFILVEPGPGKPCQRRGIDMSIVQL